MDVGPPPRPNLLLHDLILWIPLGIMKFIHAYLKNEKIKKIKAKKSEKIRRCMPEKKMAAGLLKSGFY